MKVDDHMKNLIRQTREYLQVNNPVMAYQVLRDLEKYVKEGKNYD